jgi:hypothetical protein
MRRKIGGLVSKFQLSYRLCCEFTSILGYPVDAVPDALNILCLEGVRPLPELPGLLELTGNLPDRYNDSVILFWCDANGQHVASHQATTQPGRFYTRHPLNPHGAAHLLWGHHFYRRGKHRGKPALVSASGLDRVWRDADGDFSQDPDEIVHTGRFGIHLHAGGEAESIGRWSAGCIAIHGGFDGEPYQSFLERVSCHPGKLFNLVLWRGADVRRWIAAKSGWRPTLRCGIRGSWVARLQHLLNSCLDAELIIDGDWGALTQGRFLAFQELRNLARDGICGTMTWKALEEKTQSTHCIDLIHPILYGSGFKPEIL